MKVKKSNYKPLFLKGYKYAISVKKRYRVNDSFCFILKIGDIAMMFVVIKEGDLKKLSFLRSLLSSLSELIT